MSEYFEFLVTDVEMIPITANPIEVPNCPTVLKTALAKPCVFSGKTSDMIKMSTMKSTSTLNGIRSYAGKASYQYGHFGLITDISSGAPTDIAVDMSIRYQTDILWTRKPVVSSNTAPTARLGRMRREAWRADNSWTCWKLGYVSISTILKTREGL